MQQITPVFEGYLRIYVNCPDKASEAMGEGSSLICRQKKIPDRFSLDSPRVGV
jgi:hypothetical protein